MYVLPRRKASKEDAVPSIHMNVQNPIVFSNRAMGLLPISVQKLITHTISIKDIYISYLIENEV
jgi:hypothetical protein